jgi:hypothetical protein
MTEIRVSTDTATGTGARRRTTAALRPLHESAGLGLGLRIAVVSDGRIVEEATFTRARVTIGSAPGCDLHVEGIERHRLFERVGASYRLRPPPGATSRLRVADATRTVRERARVPAGARGTIDLGATRLLFHVLVKEAPLPSAGLPLQFRAPAFGGVDWFTTVAAAFSFMAHFLAVAAIYSDFTDPVVDDVGAILQLTALVESRRPLSPPPLEQPDATAATSARGAATAAGSAESTPRAAQPRAGRGGQPGTSRAGRASEPGGGDPDARAAAIAAELAALDVHTIHTLRAGGAAATVIDGGDVPATLLDDAARSASGSDVDNPFGLKGDRASSDKPIPGAHGRRGAPARRGAEGGDAAQAGEDKKVDGPKIGASASGGDTSEGRANIPGAEGVVARLRGPFRACYQAGLGDDPTLQGSVTLVASIAANGSVASVSGGGGPLAPIMGCLKAVLQGAQFAAPRDGRGVVMVTINFWLSP